MGIKQQRRQSPIIACQFKVFQSSPPSCLASPVRQHHDSFSSDQLGGGTHSALLCGLVWQIFQLAQSLGLEILVHHIPGKWNILTDSLSRRSPVPTEWALDQSVFQVMVAHFGLSPVINLLATLKNSKLPVFISLVSMPSQSLETHSGWCMLFLPMASVCDMLMKV